MGQPLFSIHNTEEQFGTTAGGFNVTDTGVFVNDWHNIYYSRILPRSVEDLERLSTPKDYRFVARSLNTGENAFYYLAPLLNESNVAINNGYVLKSDPISGDLVDVSVDFYFSETYVFLGQTYEEERLLLPEHIWKYNNRWIASYGEPFSLFIFDPKTHQRTLIEGSEPPKPVLQRAPTHWDFAILDNVIVTGGAQVFEETDLYRGVLSEDGSQLSSLFERIGDDDFYNYIDGLGDRNIQVWHADSRTRTFFGGGAGVIIRSRDMGYSYEFVVKYPRGDNDIGVNVDPGDRVINPYMNFIETNKKYENQVIVLGSDRATYYLYFGYSNDNGSTWDNLEERVAEYGEIFVFLEQVDDGVFYAGVTRRSDETLNVLEITLPDPIGEDFGSESYIGGGWWDMSKFGLLYGASYPWIFIQDQGVWQFFEYFRDTGGWIWDFELNWLWTSKEIFPWLWSQEEGWIYYWRPSKEPRVFQRPNGSWTKVPFRDQEVAESPGVLEDLPAPPDSLGVVRNPRYRPSDELIEDYERRVAQAQVNKSKTIPDQYIIMFHKEFFPYAVRSTSEFPAEAVSVDGETLTTVARRIVEEAGGDLYYAYSHAIKGFSARLTPGQGAAIARHPMVKLVEPEYILQLEEVQASPANWGLDRIDEDNIST